MFDLPVQLSFIAALAALAVAAISARIVLKEDPGSERIREISGAIYEGATAYLKRQYTTIWIFVAIVVLLFLISGWGWRASIAFACGALSSTVAGFVGMHAAIRSNSRTANAAISGLERALKVAFRGGLVMGMSVVGVGLLGVLVFYLWFGDPQLILPFSFGASSVALFARVGGGIYTKTADVGADLVGKIEAGIPEDDPRNPAVIADNVGDNVGDVAGMGADLFESYVASLVAAMIVGYLLRDSPGFELAMILPLLVYAAGIAASIISVPFVRTKKGKDPSYALNMATVAAIAITGICVFFVNMQLFGFELGLKLFTAIASGLIAGFVVGITSDYFTNRVHKPAQFIASSSQSGAAINILSGFSIGLLSTVLPIVVIAIAVIVAYVSVGAGIYGIYGICMAGVGMLSVTGIVVASDAYGPVADNAGGIVEQSGLPEEIRDVTDSLDSVGNTTKAICKGFAIGSAALTAIGLFATYSQLTKISVLDLLGPRIVSGMFIGGAVVALFCALTILAVGRNSFRMVEEVRRQFKEIPGLLEGKGKPDYARCVDIAAKGALRELMLPSAVALIVPVAVGLTLGKEALGGFLAGAIGSGLIFALMMANAGGAWDNAKKYIEMGHFGGKKTPTHAAAVTGDTVGDPFKDTAGPSINILIKLMSMVAMIIAPFLI
ncbi:MAG: sodium-translocating pyrophosphatase [Hadesarchaea archaeon YNP_N21]|nr:MAG: sodium-translocating pyrophosphatase [Hadesarchaea archaeon YNP_N21]